MKNDKHNLSKLFKDKKAINDISIIAVLTFILLGTAIIIPFVNSEFNENIDTFDDEAFSSNVRSDAESATTISAFTILVTFFKLAFFDFGDSLGLPFWFDAIFTVLSLILILVIARNIWVGGGA